MCLRDLCVMCACVVCVVYFSVWCVCDVFMCDICPFTKHTIETYRSVSLQSTP